MTWYPIQSNPETEPISPYPILIKLSARLGIDKHNGKVIGLTRPGTKLSISRTRSPGYIDSATAPGIITKIKTHITHKTRHATCGLGYQVLHARNLVLVCWCFTSWQHLMSNQEWYCLTAHTWWLDKAAPVRDQAADTMTQFPSQTYYPDTEEPNPCPMLVMLTIKQGGVKYQFYKSLAWLCYVLATRLGNSTPNL